jgi:hypothetical protein
MLAEVKGYFSSDINDLETWMPAGPEDVFYPLQIDIGPSEAPGADAFHVQIVSPQAMKARSPVTEPLSSAKKLYFTKYSWSLVRSRIEQIVSECQAESWEEIVEKLSQHIDWEYEGFK